MLDGIPVTPGELAIGLIVTVIASTLQATIAFGFSVVSVPILALINPLLAPIPQILVLPLITGSLAIREWNALDVKGFKWVLVGRFAGTGVGLGLLALASKTVLDIILAIIVLAAVGALATMKTVPRNRVTESIAGLFSGIGSTVSSIGGPPLAMLYRDAGGGTLRSSLGVIMSIGLAVTIISLSLSGFIMKDHLIVALYLAPAVLVGLYLSRFLIGRVEEPLKRGITIVAVLLRLVSWSRH